MEEAAVLEKHSPQVFEKVETLSSKAHFIQAFDE